ncbi:hypothetical protein H5410_019916 [Solanum commersonii]|uniref:Uncharacterized protein n=1 Tax=Solanum commersonii TaxID=4109 RepID=A0A9J5Z6K6_SOLCO|nr:hypothetical protein H5410_019916 [Solanum commersonii]
MMKLHQPKSEVLRWFYSVGVYHSEGHLCGYDGTRVILVRVMGYITSAIDRAYEIVHIIFGLRLNCFVVDLAVLHDMLMVGGLRVSNRKDL